MGWWVMGYVELKPACCEVVNFCPNYIIYFVYDLAKTFVLYLSMPFIN